MPLPEPRPVELCKRMAAVRGEIRRLRKLLPDHYSNQSEAQAKAAYWLDTAADRMQQAERAWDPPSPKGEA